MTTAADRLALDAIRATTIRAATRIALVLVLIVAFGMTYCAGKSQGTSKANSAWRDSVRKVQAHAIDSLNAKHRVDSMTAVETSRVAEQKREKYVEARRPVRIKNDTTLIVTRGDTTITVVVPPEVPLLIERADTVVIVDSLALRAKVAELVDVTAQRDVAIARYTNDEAQIKEMKPSRFGLKTGMALGATLVGLLVYLIK